MKNKFFNRKKRKLQWIRAKNLARKYPDCDYGDFYCEHIFDSELTHSWLDFKFFHSTKKIIYSVAMETLGYQVYSDAEDEVLNVDPNDWIIDSGFERMDEINQRIDDIVLSKKHFRSPSILIKDYGPVYRGIYACVNTTNIGIDEIRKFILWFRSLGEPTTPGFKWIGSEVEVNFEEIKKTD